MKTTDTENRAMFYVVCESRDNKDGYEMWQIDPKDAERVTHPSFTVMDENEKERFLNTLHPALVRYYGLIAPVRY